MKIFYLEQFPYACNYYNFIMNESLKNRGSFFSIKGHIKLRALYFT
jgi:hypothetical protein